MDIYKEISRCFRCDVDLVMSRLECILRDLTVSQVSQQETKPVIGNECGKQHAGDRVAILLECFKDGNPD